MAGLPGTKVFQVEQTMMPLPQQNYANMQHDGGGVIGPLQCAMADIEYLLQVRHSENDLYQNIKSHKPVFFIIQHSVVSDVLK